MDSTRPIRALLRGLDALAALNIRDGASVSELVGAIRLPRTTIYRVLETLSDAGYVRRDPADDRYRLTPMVRGLSDSFDAEASLATALEPAVAGLARSLRLPAGIATLSGTRMRLRECAASAADWTTAYQPLATGAAGRAYLAQCPAAERERLVDLLCAPYKGDARAVSRAELLAALQGIAAQGYAHDAERLCLALRVAGGRLAVLTVRSAGPQAAAERQLLLGAMRACVQSASGVMAEQPSGTHRAGVPAAAH